MSVCILIPAGIEDLRLLLFSKCWPTIGLILCTEKNETVARYSVLNDRKQIFASKYMLFLPTEEQLRLEIEKERRCIEATQGDPSDA